MDLTVAGKGIAPVELLATTIKALLGAFEISFHFRCATYPIDEDKAYELVINSARVLMTVQGSNALDLGLARPDEVALIRQMKYVSKQDLILKLVLTPYQMDLLENARTGADLNFTLTFKYRGGVREGSQAFEQAETAAIPVHVPQSTWVKQLNDSGADKILLFEVRLPGERDLSHTDPAAQHLVDAQRHFTQGNYTEAVFQCRLVTEELLRQRTKTVFEEFPNGQARLAMTKADREDYLTTALQLYSHQAAHSGSKDGETYTRTEAKMALAVASALVSRKFSRI
jgi:hypothetical protein